jgi:hypothetical protein
VRAIPAAPARQRSTVRRPDRLASTFVKLSKRVAFIATPCSGADGLECGRVVGAARVLLEVAPSWAELTGG